MNYPSMDKEWLSSLLLIWINKNGMWFANWISEKFWKKLSAQSQLWLSTNLNCWLNQKPAMKAHFELENSWGRDQTWFWSLGGRKKLSLWIGWIREWVGKKIGSQKSNRQWRSNWKLKLVMKLLMSKGVYENILFTLYTKIQST